MWREYSECIMYIMEFRKPKVKFFLTTKNAASMKGNSAGKKELGHQNSFEDALKP